MITIKVYDNNSIKAISKLKSILVNEGLFKELKSRKYYKKPSLKKRLKREEARKRHSIHAPLPHPYLRRTEDRRRRPTGAAVGRDPP